MPGKSCRGRRITLLSSRFAPDLSRFYLDLSRFSAYLQAFRFLGVFSISRLISAYLGMFLPSNGLNIGLKQALIFNLDHRHFV